MRIEWEFTLVYQLGIANIFRRSLTRPSYPDRERVYQGDYRSAEAITRGAQLAGARIQVMHCNRAGDIAAAGVEWQPGAGELWNESKHPPMPADQLLLPGSLPGNLALFCTVRPRRVTLARAGRKLDPRE